MKELKLAKTDLVALVDDDMHEELSKYAWYYSFANKEKSFGYPRMTEYVKGKKKKNYSLHKFIFERILDIRTIGLYIDHVNRNTLDNRRDNLRLASPTESGRNKGPERNNQSGYRGVCPLEDSSINPWRAYISVARKQINLGVHPTKEAAALAYNEAAIKYFGEFAYLNKIRSK